MLADNLGYGELGVYGGGILRGPREDRLVGLLRIVAVEEVDLLVDRLRPFQRQRAFVLARLVA